MLCQAGLKPIAVSIHGGDAVSREYRGCIWYRVPKRDLIGVVQVALHAQRLRIAAAHPMASTLIAEMQNYRVTIDPRTAHDSYAAWREGIHDDLVLACALAVLAWGIPGHAPCPCLVRRISGISCASPPQCCALDRVPGRPHRACACGCRP